MAVDDGHRHRTVGRTADFGRGAAAFLREVIAGRDAMKRPVRVAYIVPGSHGVGVGFELLDASETASRGLRFERILCRRRTQKERKGGDENVVLLAEGGSHQGLQSDPAGKVSEGLVRFAFFCFWLAL